MFRALLLMLLVLSTLGAVGPEPAGRKEERALAAALDWLVRHQGPDGGWSGHGFAGTCAALVPDSKGVRRSRKAKAFEACEGHAKPGYEVGLTGLALWALVEGGIEPDQERHGEAVRKARVFLLDAQDGETGQFGTRQSHTFLYDHALATLALARLVPLVEGDAETETLATLQKAVYFLARAKNPYSAWGYSEPPNGTNNLSLTVWCLEAGHAARDAGVDVPTSLVESPLGYLDELLDRETGRIGYNQTGSRSSRITGQNDHFDPSLGEAMTAAGLWQVLRAPEGEERLEELEPSVELLLQCLPVWDEEHALAVDPYYWHLGTRAMVLAGKKPRKAWTKAMTEVLLEHQVDEDCATGSWSPDGPWGAFGGRVYSTSLMAMSLAVLMTD